MVALSIVLAPEIGALFAKEQLPRLRVVYRTATLWLTIAAVPLLVLMAWFPSLLLSIVGGSFAGGGKALAVLSFTNIISIALGPIVMVLSMGGRSGSVLVASVTSLVVNLVINLVLIPPFGVVGAAIAWSVSIVTISAISAVRCWRLWDLHPVSWALVRTVIGAVLCVSAGCAAARLWAGESWPAFLSGSVASLILYAPVVFSVRDELRMSSLLRGEPMGVASRLSAR